MVDDGGAIPLDKRMAGFHDQIELKLVRQKNAGPANARNTGATHAKGEFLAFTDDDCAPATDWLQRLEACCVRNPDSAIGGKTINALPDDPYATASQLLMTYLYTYYNRSGYARFLASNNLAMPAQRFHAAGGFDDSFPRAAGEDREFCERWLQHGFQMNYAPEVRIYHAHEFTFRKFWRQHFNYGRGAFHYHHICSWRRKHNGREPLSFYMNLLRYPFSRPWKRRTPFLGILFMVTQLANTAGYFWEQANRKKEGIFKNRRDEVVT